MILTHKQKQEKQYFEYSMQEVIKINC